MTQTDVMQQVREMTGHIRASAIMAMFDAGTVLGQQCLPVLGMPNKFNVYVAYNGFGIIGIKHYITYLRCSEEPMVMMSADAQSYTLHWHGQGRSQANEALGKVKWLGVRVDGDRSRIIR